MSSSVTDSSFGFSYTTAHQSGELAAFEGLCERFERSPLPLARKLQNFARHVRRQDLARFLARNELFSKILTVNGSIVECGVFCGGGLMTWAHLSAIHEPFNHTRRIYGFDTFSGFPDAHAKDTIVDSSERAKAGALSTHETIVDELEELIKLHDANRPLGHVQKVELIAGDACQTIPKFIEDKPHALISLLYLDFDLYEPTKCALQHLLPRVPRGGIIAFDELNCPQFPGETQALLECLDLRQVELKRFPFEPWISYFVRQ